MSNETKRPETMKTSTKVHVSDRPYVTSHGRSPRGFGSWGFCPANKWDSNDYLNHVVFFKGTYAEARKEAKAHFALLGISFVVVCS